MRNIKAVSVLFGEPSSEPRLLTTVLLLPSRTESQSFCFGLFLFSTIDCLQSISTLTPGGCSFLSCSQHRCYSTPWSSWLCGYGRLWLWWLTWRTYKRKERSGGGGEERRSDGQLLLLLRTVSILWLGCSQLGAAHGPDVFCQLTRGLEKGSYILTHHKQFL